jgi:hypothetical protein
VVDANASDGASGASRNEEGVLANLPRTRPQRSSARRAAARAGTAAAKRPGKPLDAKAPTAKRAAKAGTRTSARAPETDSSKPPVAQKRRAAPPKRSPISLEDPAPRQGFECDGETASSSIQPPGGAELVASAAEILGEFAKAGLSTGERLLKDVVSRLPLS